MQMRDKIRGMQISDLKQDLVFFCGLSNCAFIPFIVLFPQLCLEVSQYWQKWERILRDIKGKIIMDFSPDTIKTTFQWTSKGTFEYAEAESLACYQDTNRVVVAIRN